MSLKPDYFEAVRDKAARRWDQLEADLELAAPWHQLFRQVQSPRHVLSELLQNADDAGAVEAEVKVEDGAFIFRHNGEDFAEEHFASLCRFGYSNKRALHTIGFRGIGFKSTFSLGDTVDLLTPSLSVQFNRQRFTEPRWVARSGTPEKTTIIRVQLKDEHLHHAVEDSFSEWLKSPVSLLFFRNIRRLKIGESLVHWTSGGSGPVANSEWFSLDGNQSKKHLFVRSKPVPFPEDALNEIREERMLADPQDLELPPCEVELVLGSEGRFFVVLPTGVTTDLPFACNAPFLQDAARYKIKDPAQSPTNRFLLQCLGTLAGETMIAWLGKTEFSSKERAPAYDLLPDVDRDATTLESKCATDVELAFENSITQDDSPILLTDQGFLTPPNTAVALPRELFEVWERDFVISAFDESSRPPISHEITYRNLQKIKSWGWVEDVDHQNVLDTLQEKKFPSPQNWKKLLTLWYYVGRLVESYEYDCTESSLHIVPVQGKDTLHCAAEVVRLGEKRILPSEDDWKFLGDHLSVLSQHWLRYLTEQRRNGERAKDKFLNKIVETADILLSEIGLDEPSDTGIVIDLVAKNFFSSDTVLLHDMVRFTHIAAKLGAQIGDHFKYATQDRKLRGLGHSILFDNDGSLEIILPDDWAERCLLHGDYTKHFKSCSKEEWDNWISSGRSGLLSFVPFKETYSRYWTRRSIDDELSKRAYQGPFSPRYSHPSFSLTDWDFEQTIWQHWEKLEEELPSIWAIVAERILSETFSRTSHATATVQEQASNGHTSRCVRTGLAPTWVMRLRNKPCLKDAHGIHRKPEELLMRAPQTEALLDVEPFIHGTLDTERNRSLLKLLGVSDRPTGPEKLLLRLKALASAEIPPAHEVDKWYRRLDQLVDGCSTEMFHKIRSDFETKELILSDKGSWENKYGIFLSSDAEEVPHAPLVRSSVRDLTLWRKIGVADQPTPDLAIEWLSKLPSSKVLDADDIRRVRGLLGRYPTRIWEECGHWLNLAGEWATIETLDYSLAMQTLTSWGNLHQWAKQKTADFRSVPNAVTLLEPFTTLSPLASVIDDQFHRKPSAQGTGESLAWLQELGLQLARVVLEDDEEASRIRTLAARLCETRWITTSNLEIIPYIDGKPAGTPRRAEALWLDGSLYVENKPLAKLARIVAQELGKAFRRLDIIDAIKLCFDRPPEFIKSYMDENFDLVPAERVELVKVPASSTATEEDCNEQPSANTLGSPFVEEAAPNEQTVTSDVEEPEPAKPTLQHYPEPEAPIPNNPTTPLQQSIREPTARPAKPSLMERFSVHRGFRKSNDGHFCNAEREVIGKAHGSLFPWELRDAAGTVIKRYLPREHCLEREPLQMEAEVWGLLEHDPDSYSLVLIDPSETPIEVSGNQLTKLREIGVIQLHPSTYRLVMDHDRK
ncbi:sacsin N-terminal ATP-binding-like domain-containing protein [Roseibium aggregatum]|uniref:DNA mismatch repair enzyme (Predicted ATPase) n=1 Tax=Roseibium aggregatum TaxID=187304 RepID=A0A0M6Y933_9HYPH|nr:ATPase [Roseibium aggregatum]CTQ45310.1 DNA mismatch repair enzyme (predicted ATPase) [Roseibium aggregatum]